MNYIIPIEDFLFESKRTAKENFLDRGLISEEDFNLFLDVDATPTKKFIDSMCQFYSQGSSKEEIIETFQKAIPMFIKNIIKVDIKSVKSLDELKSLIEEKQDYKTRSEVREEARDGAEITFQNSRFVVRYITTREASVVYGIGTKWCISSKGDDRHWNGYNEAGSSFYFIIDNKLNEDDPRYKIAVQFTLDKDVNVWNAIDNDEEMSNRVVGLEYIYKQGIPDTAFKYHIIKDFSSILQEKYLIDVRGRAILNSRGEYDIIGDVLFWYTNYTKIPVKFGEVSGYFDCSRNKLTTLKNCPTSVGGYFSCYNNHLTSLKFAPTSVGGYFDCSNNNLTTLKDCPTSVGGYFSCYKQKNEHKFTEDEVRAVCQVGSKIYTVSI